MIKLELHFLEERSNVIVALFFFTFPHFCSHSSIYLDKNLEVQESMSKIGWNPQIPWQVQLIQ